MSVETKKYEGYWWFPSDPEKKVTGSLSINQREGIELRTIGSLVPRQDFFNSELDHISSEIILGQAVDGNLITLIGSNCINQRRNPSSSSIDLSTSTYASRIAVIGESYFVTRDDVIFTSADIRFSLLDEWLCRSGFKDSAETNAKGNLHKFNLEYEYPEVIEFDIDSLKAKFKTNYIFHQEESHFKWYLTHKSFLSIVPEKPQSIDWYMQKFESLRRFLTVVSGFPVSITDIITYGSDFYDDKNIKTKEQFQIYVKLPSSFIETSDKHPTELLTNLPLLGTDLATILNSWFQNIGILDPAIILYVATLSIDLGYSEFQLLNYAQALEALHRRVFGGNYMTDDEYKPIYKTVTQSIPEGIEGSHKSSLKSRIKYGNGFPQTKRLELLLEGVWEGCLSEFVDDKETFISKVITTRNHLIHSDPSSKSKAVSGTEIFYVAERLKILLIAHILLQLNIPKENVYRAVKSFREFSYLKHQK